MANPSTKLFNFYQRYRWRAQDFTDFQTGMVDTTRDTMEGLFAGAVLQGFGVTPIAMQLQIAEGIASGREGFLHVLNDTTLLDVEAPVGNPVRHLVVIRPKITQTEYITRPTNPFDSVPLVQLQESEIVLVEGTPAVSPTYPAVEDEDVILFGLRLQPAQSSIVALTDIDFNVRDIPGKNSNFQQDFGRYDDRLRPYQFSNQVLAIKPSQLEGPFSRVFSYVARAAPSIFPKDSGGDYNPLDTYVNFQTGAITGGDETTPDFTPQIPTAGNCIVATVGILNDDTLNVAFGTIGTREECFDGIINQKSAGAGSVEIPTNTKLVAFVILSSSDGTNIRELDYFDCRGIAAVGESAAGLGGGGTTTPAPGDYPLTLTPDDDGRVILVDTSLAARTIILPTVASGFKVTIKDIAGQAHTNPITLQRPTSGVNIEGLDQDYLLEARFGQWNVDCDGAAYWLI